jgi:hypothetical protein
MKSIFLSSFICCLFLTTCNISTYAQQKKHVKVVPKPKTTVVVKKVTQENSLFKSMLGATAKVMFIDSVVVDKDDFLLSIPFSHEIGSIDYNGNVSSYTNEYDNHKIIASGDSINGRYLYVYDKIGDKWCETKKIDYFDTFIHSFDYPFLQSDGITMFFAAKGNKSIGGYDIFTTNYDSDKERFLDPVNYGLPYNSTANDYFLAIDDIDSLGWLVSDRYQPKDKVCIYTFVPPATRLNFENSDITEAELTKYAKLHKISDTWQFGNRNKAFSSLNDLKERNLKKDTSKNNFYFVINDNIIYTKLSDFKSEISRNDFTDLLLLMDKAKTNRNDLDVLYDNYQAASLNQKRNMANKIKKLEISLENMRKEIDVITAKIRKEEIK